MIPRELLARARDLLARDDPTTAGLWPRCVAFLLRQALEGEVEAFVDRLAPGMRDTPMRSQLIALTVLCRDQGLARRVVYAWHALSEATHYQACELAPGEVDLNAWLSTVEAFVDPSATQETR